MKRLAVELINNQTIIHEGEKLDVEVDGDGFKEVWDYKEPPTGGLRRAFIAAYNVQYIARIWDATND
jgi:hypothetical protein